MGQGGKVLAGVRVAASAGLGTELHTLTQSSHVAALPPVARAAFGLGVSPALEHGGSWLLLAGFRILTLLPPQAFLGQKAAVNRRPFVLPVERQQVAITATGSHSRQSRPALLPL